MSSSLGVAFRLALARGVVAKRDPVLLRMAINHASKRVATWRPEYPELIAIALRRCLTELAAALARLPLRRRDHDGVLAHDEAVAAVLERVGDTGGHLASKLRTRSRTALAAFDLGESDARSLLWLWRGRPPRALGMFAAAIAVDVVQPACATPPAVSLSVAVAARDGFWGRGELIGRRVLSGGRVVADAVEADDEVLRRVFRAVHTLAGHRLFRWLLAVGQRQHLVGEPDPRAVVIHGGFEELAATVGVRGHKAATELAQALDGMQRLRVALPGGFVGGLLTYNIARARRTTLRIVLGDPLFPSWVSTLPKGSGTRREARMLVPVPLALPPMAGREREHAALATLQVELLMEFRKRAEELTDGGVLIDDWRPLLERSGVPGSTWEAARLLWTAPGPDQVLVPQPDGRLLLGAAYAAESAMICAAGVRQREGRRDRQRRRRRR